MWKRLLGTAVAALIAGFAASFVAFFLLQPPGQASRRDEETSAPDELSDREQEQLLRELESLT